MGQAGTLEMLLMVAARALRPLGSRLAAGDVLEFVTELGLRLPPPVLERPELIDALNAGATAVSRLSSLADQLELAVEADDVVEMVRLSVELVLAIEALVDAIDTLGTELRAAASGLPGADATFVERFAGELAEGVTNYLAVRHLEAYQPRLLHLLVLLGVVERLPVRRDPTDPMKPSHLRRRLRLDRVPELLESPADMLRSLYGWGGPEFEGVLLLERLQTALFALGVPAVLERQPTPAMVLLRLSLLELRPRADLSPPGLGAALRVLLPGGLKLSVAAHGWTLELETEGELQAGVEAVVRPPATVEVVPPSGRLDGRLALRLVRSAQGPSAPLLILGQPGGARLEADRVQFEIGTAFRWDATEGAARGDVHVEAEIRGARLSLALADADGFLTSVVSRDRLSTEFDFLIGWSGERGVYTSGAAGLETLLPIYRSFGPFALDTLHIAIVPASGALEIELSASGSILLGPVAVSIERVGARAMVGLAAGDLGVTSLRIQFKPPTGAGLAIDAGAVVGGGYLFFDPAKEEYAGILQLEIEETLTLTAIGLLTTRLPDGSKGFSLLVLITAEGFRPIPLGYGFTLNGVGGLLGVNRTVRVDVLRAGLRTRTLDAVLFPENPVARAPQILSTLRTVFPPAEGRYVVGPMAILGWGTPTLVTFTVGIVLELPAPVRLVLLGQVRACLPDPAAPLIVLQMDVLGVIDFDRRDVSIDATLYDSRLVQYALTGDMALRASWGASPTFVLAVGGLHPRFAAPPGFPRLRRVAVSLATGDNPRIRLEGYLALTANTAQVGARLEVAARQGSVSLEGMAGFDALFTFRPFRFEADVEGRVALRVHGRRLAAVELDMTLTGPRPWHARGRARFKTLFVTHSVRFEVEVGGAAAPEPAARVDVGALLRAAVADARNWQGELPAGVGPWVTVRPAGGDGVARVSPQGALTLRQRVVPLGVTIARFGTETPIGERRFALREVRLGGQAVGSRAVTEAFAPGQYLELSDDEKLGRPSFEALEAGVRMTPAPGRDGGPVRAPLVYETVVVDARAAAPGEAPAEAAGVPVEHVGALARHGATGRAAIRRTGRAKYRAAGRPLGVGEAPYMVATTAALAPETIPGLAAGARASYTEAAEALGSYLLAHPERRGSLQVVRA